MKMYTSVILSLALLGAAMPTPQRGGHGGGGHGGGRGGGGYRGLFPTLSSSLDVRPNSFQARPEVEVVTAGVLASAVPASLESSEDIPEELCQSQSPLG
jgi:hypothetical protein